MGSSTGASIHMHYCMGKLAGWGFGHNDTEQCGKCGMKKTVKKNSCCKDEQKFLKFNADQKSTESVFQLQQLMPVALPAKDITIGRTDVSFNERKTPLWLTPHRISSIHLFLRYCVFRI